jgi:hypothetical protein
VQALDDFGQWYRYHALFSEAMQHEARRRFGDAALRSWYSRASAWYEQQSLLPDAIEMALHAQQYARAAGLIEQSLKPHFAYKQIRLAGDAACVAVGRDPATFGRSTSVVVNLSMTQGQHWRRSQARSEEAEPASAEEIAEIFRGYAREGLSHVQVWLSPSTIDSLEWFATVLERLDSE